MVWQRAGTVAVQNGSTTVVGTNVNFAASSRNGDSFVGPDGATYEVANVASATVISILPAYKGPTVAGASYAIMPVQGYDKMLSDAFNNLNNQFGTILADLGENGPSIKVNAAGLLADRATYDGRSAGFAYYATDTELLYIKLGGAADAWSLGAPVAVGPAGPTGDVTPEALQARDDAQAAAVAASDSASTAAPLGFRLFKAQPNAPAWAKSGGSLITAQALTYVLGGVTHKRSTGTIISLPTLTAGNDYAIYATTDGRLVADLNWSAPRGEPAGTTRKIGGFHVALTREIFEYSLWDINYRPTCPDPRGMVCINGMFWADIYLLGVNHHIDGTSRAGVTIADGESPPKIPAIYGGNGSTAYGSLTWFETQDVLQSHGKRCPSWAEFSMLAFGAAEATAVGVDPVTTKHDAPRRSRWGVEQATGNLWVWGAETQGNAGGGWAAITGGRGSVSHSDCTAVLLGASWGDGANSGSRSANWSVSPSYSIGNIGGRGLSDHLRLLAER